MGLGLMCDGMGAPAEPSSKATGQEQMHCNRSGKVSRSVLGIALLSMLAMQFAQQKESCTAQLSNGAYVIMHLGASCTNYI